MNPRVALLVLSVSACGPQSDSTGETGSAGDVSSTGDGSTTEETATVSSPTADPSTTSSADDADSSGSSAADTEIGETCVPGAFVGLYSIRFESSAFESCATGESWWFAGGGGYETCPAQMWVTVEGEVCGPGQYGHLGQSEYELRGEIVEGPCDASCGDTPAPAACTTFEELCPIFACDPFGQDCPRGQRCAPSGANDAPPWTGSRCVALTGPPQPVGGGCTSEAPWQDDCMAEAHCPSQGDAAGTCAALCFPEVGACDVGTCWPCDFVDKPAPVGVCGEAEVAC